MRVGNAAVASGDAEAATAFYRRAAALSPSDIDAQLAYAQVLADAGRPAEAVAVARALRQRRDDDPRIGVALGQLLVVSGQPREAVVVLTDASRRYTGNPRVLIALGVALDATGNHPAAQAEYRRVLAVAPDDVSARADLGLSLTLAGSYPEALGILRPLRTEIAGSQRTEQIVAVDNALALTLGLMGDTAAAAAILRRRMSAESTAENLRFYGTIRSAGGRSVQGAAEPAVGSGPSRP